MKRFSQRQQLVTLSDINITPLLDLAFVLLIIFIITTPLLEQGINLKLPTGGVQDDNELDPKNIWAVDIGTDSYYYSKGYRWQLQQIAPAIRRANSTNENLLVYVRADETTPYKYIAAFLNEMEEAGVEQVSLRTEPEK